MYDLKYLKEFFKNDLFAVEALGANIIDASNDYAKCSLEIQDKHKNAKGLVMGGAIFTLADFTFAVATNQHEEYFTVSTTANISYLRAVTLSKYLNAEAIKLKDGKMVCFYEVNVYDDSNTLIAKVNISGTHIAK